MKQQKEIRIGRKGDKNMDEKQKSIEKIAKWKDRKLTQIRFPEELTEVKKDELIN